MSPSSQRAGLGVLAFPSLAPAFAQRTSARGNLNQRGRSTRYALFSWSTVPGTAPWKNVANFARADGLAHDLL